VSVNEVFVCFV